MREFFHNMKLSFLLAAVLYVILGLVLLIWPGVSATVFCYAFGGILLIYGVVTIVSFFLRDSRQGSFVFELFLGIVAAALGLLFLLRPVIVASVLPVILGLFIVVDGLVNLKRALELRRFERDDALRLAGELGVEVTVLELDALADPRVAANPAERCYYCKQNLFRALKARAAADGYTVLLDGTNASDEAGDRPGMRALRELEVRSPLRECGLTKADIRRLSREAGLFTWDKPAYACLATRIPTGEALTGEALARVEGAEDALFRLGYADFRVRVFHGAARLQLPAGQLERAVRERAALRAALAPYFKPILLDLEER